MKDATTNSCSLCMPLGACLAFKGIKGAMNILHGSQGCATYIRRYMISHFREPMDIASSSFSEEAAVFGGEQALFKAIQNVSEVYKPVLIGIASTCLSETIGDDLNRIVKEYKKKNLNQFIPEIINVSSPSYKGSHFLGFHQTVKAIVKQLASDKQANDFTAVFPGMVSPADLRHIKEIFGSFRMPYCMVPDYSETLDGGRWDEYLKIPPGGTDLRRIRRIAGAKASVTLGSAINPLANGAGKVLYDDFGVPLYSLKLPIGIRSTDQFLSVLESISQTSPATWLLKERSRLVDAYGDAHKYLFGKTAAVYGDEDMVVGLTSLLSEWGIKVVLAASGGNAPAFQSDLADSGAEKDLKIMAGADFDEIEKTCFDLKPDIMVGSSKGKRIANEIDAILLKTGFPVHDEFGAQRILSVAYRGATALLDKLVNKVIEQKEKKLAREFSYI